jgi:cobalt-zinc-cadmium resistance protein CzcA
LQAINAGYAILVNQFNLLINCSKTYEPLPIQFILTVNQFPGLALLEQTPAIKLQDANIVKSEQQLKLEKSKLLPSFNLGYNSATIIGWQTTTQNNETYYGSDHRFASFNMGLSVPLFMAAQKAKINASNIAIEQNKLEREAVSQQLQSNFKDVMLLYVQNKKIVEDYQNKILPNAKLLIESAAKKMNAGEISYLEWVMIINQAIQSQSDYFAYVQQLNEAALELEKISANN